MNSEWEKARLQRDENFNGIFYWGDSRQNEFCLPTCSKKSVAAEHVRFFSSICDAYDNGYSPCKICQPDIYAEQRLSSLEKTGSIFSQALTLIYNGYLSDHTVKELADSLDVSERKLRREFDSNIGIPPIAVAKYHKAGYAKKLLVFSEHSVTEVAYAAGFSSVRQFNDVINFVYKKTPTIIRTEAASSKIAQDFPQLFINYKSMSDFSATLNKIKKTAIPQVEHVTKSSYSRTYRTPEAIGYFRVSNDEPKKRLVVDIHTCDIRIYENVVEYIRNLFEIAPCHDFQSRTFVDFESNIKSALSTPQSQEMVAKVQRLVEAADDRTKPAFPLSHFFPLPTHVLALPEQISGLSEQDTQRVRKIARQYIEVGRA